MHYCKKYKTNKNVMSAVLELQILQEKIRKQKDCNFIHVDALKQKYLNIRYGNWASSPLFYVSGIIRGNFISDICNFDDKRHFSYKVSSACIKNLDISKGICPFWSGNSILSLNAGEICVYLIFKLYVSVRSINHFMCQNKFFSNIQITKFYHRSFNKFSYFHSCTQ